VIDLAVIDSVFIDVFRLMMVMLHMVLRMIHWTTMIHLHH